MTPVEQLSFSLTVGTAGYAVTYALHWAVCLACLGVRATARAYRRSR
jgi:hypothetical protein